MLRFHQTVAANNGTPQQPSKTSERLEGLKNCKLGYYGVNLLSVTAKLALIAAGAGGIPKAINDENTLLWKASHNFIVTIRVSLSWFTKNSATKTQVGRGSSTSLHVFVKAG